MKIQSNVCFHFTLYTFTLSCNSFGSLVPRMGLGTRLFYWYSTHRHPTFEMFMRTQLYDALLPKHKNALLQHTYHNQQFEFGTFSLPPPHTRCCTAYYQSCDLQSGSWCIFSGCLHNLQQQMFVLHEGQRKKETRCQWLEQHVTHTAYIQYCNQSTLVTSSSIQYAKICHVLNHDSLTLSKKIGS